MSAPDTTPAFESEAETVDKDAEIARLKAQIANGEPLEGALEVADDGPAVPRTVTVRDSDWTYHLPTEGQMMMFGMSSARRASGQRRINAIYNFLDAVLTDDSYSQLEDRINDPDDDFDVEAMMDVITSIIEAANDTPAAKAPKNGPTLR